MNGPPKKKRGLCGTAPRTFKLRLGYLAAAFLANLFSEPFWFWEQKRAQLLDRIDNERSGQ
jgi:hypothetical protein